MAKIGEPHDHLEPHPAHAVGDEPDRPASLDRTQLLVIADQPHIGTAAQGVADDRVQVWVPDVAASSMTSTSPARESYWCCHRHE